ncbi:MAG: DUF433 domain-containing protein [Acidobacteriia bacterium]|nr:DUF433 domain-containing protein [Terriglobia bacterium]
MKVGRRELGINDSLRRDTDWTRGIPHGLPDSWLEAREKANALPCDETQTIGEVFDRAISKAHHAIWRDKRVLRGVPCIRNTRVPIYQICGMIAEGYSPKKVAKFMSISEQQVSDALRFASILLEQ